MEDKLPNDADARIAALDKYVAQQGEAPPSHGADLAGWSRTIYVPTLGASMTSTSDPSVGLIVEFPGVSYGASYPHFKLTHAEIRIWGTAFCVALAVAAALWVGSRRRRPAA